MAQKRNLKESETLELYRVSIENTSKQLKIASIMTEFGYDEETMSSGRGLLAEARKAYDMNKTEDDETSEAYGLF